MIRIISGLKDYIAYQGPPVQEPSGQQFVNTSMKIDEQRVKLLMLTISMAIGVFRWLTVMLFKHLL